jgi:exodeoxyribonuclease VII large subunit
VADLRAATPSAAAEILTAGYVASRERIESLQSRLPRLLYGALADRLGQADELQRRLARVHPRRRLEDHGQRLDELVDALRTGVSRALRERRRSGSVLGQRLLAARPSARLIREVRRQQELRRRLLGGAKLGLNAWRERLARVQDRLRLLSPEAVLERGYSITLDAATGAVVRDAAEIRPGQKLTSRLAKGRVSSVVVEST